MTCPTCSGHMSETKSRYTTHGSDGTAYNAWQYRCAHDDNYLTWEVPQDTEESSEE